MQESFSDFKDFIRSLQILHIAMVVGAILTLLILKYVIGVQNSESDPVITYTFMGMASLPLLLSLPNTHLLFEIA